MKVGTKVIKNPDTWQVNDFDIWGRGVGVGEVVEPPFTLEPGTIDVRWPAGRCFEKQEQLLAYGTLSPCWRVWLRHWDQSARDWKWKELCLVTDVESLGMLERVLQMGGQDFRSERSEI